MKKFPMIAAVAAMTAATIVPSAASADHRHRNSRYEQQHNYNDRYHNNRYYGQSRQRCRSGTTGAILGAAAGALLGREVIGRRGDRTLGTIIGGAGGGLAGRELTRDKRCR